MKQVLVTTSWDDGHKQDVRLARLLKKYGIAGTFYVSPEDHEFDRADLLRDTQIRAIAKDFEIGAHTVTHPHLDRLDEHTAQREIAGSKERLEAITGKPVTSFCYPYGSFNAQTKQLVERAGFSYARTVQRFATRSIDRFAAATTADTFDHRRDGLRAVLRLCGRRPWRVCTLWRWDNLAKELFARARERGEVFHLWGHSHEIDAHGNWDRLEKLLAWLAAQPDVRFVTNAEVPIARPKVLMTAPYFKPHTGGLEEYTFQVAKGLQRDYNWDVVVVSSEKATATQVEQFKGIKVYRLPRRWLISNTPISLTWRKQLRQIIASERPDVINAHAPVPGMLDATTSAARRTPLVVTYHTGSMKKGRHGIDLLIAWYEGTLLKGSLHKARAIICSSPFVQQSYMGRFFQKTSVITPGVDTSLFKPALTLRRQHHLLHVGGLKPGEAHKGLRHSLDTVARLKPLYPDVHLTVVGDGANSAYYRQLAADLGIARQVHFAGRLQGKEMAAAYQSAQVLLAPSHKESFGMVAAEALACGVPVIAGNVDGLAELIEHGKDGLVVNPDDLEGIVRAVRQLFDDPAAAEAMGTYGRTLMKKQYTWRPKVEATHRLLGRAAGLPGGQHSLKVLLATPYYAPKVGGLENYAHNIARQLGQRGWEVVAVTSNHQGGNVAVDVVDGVRVYRLPALIQFSNTPLGLLWALRVRRIIRRERPDIINGHTPVPGMADAAAWGSGRTPFVLTYHAATLYKQGNRPFNTVIGCYRILERLMLHKARQIVAVTPYHQDRMPRGAGRKLHRIENAIPQADLLPAPAAKTPRHLIFIGNLVKAHAWKGLEETLQAIAEYNRSASHPVHLDIVGGGDYISHYQRAARRLKLQTAVTFHGQQTGASKQKLLARAEGLVCYPTSAQDAFPTTLLEAWAHWVPVIAADIGALPHIIRDGQDGMLVPPHSPSALASAIGVLLDNEPLRRTLAVGGHARASTLTWTHQGERTDTLFRELLG